jgi:putative nucleotidyltransferase with HDIG domain
MDAVEAAKHFVRDAFIKNPKFSFNDWTIMYDHSLHVLDLSLKISKKVICNKAVVSLGALLHDIGKTYEADEETLIKNHARLAWTISGDFLNRLDLRPAQLYHLKEILGGNLTGPEGDIIHDADIIAFLVDERLQSAFQKWAKSKNMDGEMRRKIDKFNSLRLGASREIGRKFYDQARARWLSK